MTDIEDCGSYHHFREYYLIHPVTSDDGMIQLIQQICQQLIEKGTEDEEILEACRCYLNISVSTLPPFTNMTPPQVPERIKLSSGSVTTLTFLYCVVFCLTIIGNLAVVGVVLMNANFRNRATVLILSLAIADLLIAGFCMPMNVVFIRDELVWTLGNGWCKAVNFIQMLAVVANVLTLAAIATERYLAIVFPLWSKASPSMSHMIVYVICQWIIAAIFATPCAIWYHSPQFTEDLYMRSCTITADDSEKLKIYRLMILLLLFICPITLSSVMYFIIGYTLWAKNSINLQSSHFEHVRLRTTRRVISMLILVLVLFSVCWAPTMIFELMWMYRAIDLNQVTLNTKYYLQWLAMCNSCFNPIVYTFLHEKFRKAVTCHDNRARRRKRNQIQPVSVNAGLQPPTVSTGSTSNTNKQQASQSKCDVTKTTVVNVIFSSNS